MMLKHYFHTSAWRSKLAPKAIAGGWQEGL
jgi:hypothetical protein